ncbi:hypothetical protein ACE09Y_04105 [Raphidiopsis sp. BLCC-F218]
MNDLPLDTSSKKPQYKQYYRQFFQICLKPYLQRHDFIGFQDFG